MTYVYFIQQGYGAIKIGVSDDPDKRCSDMQTGSSKRLRVVARIPMEDRRQAMNLEKELHAAFSSLRIRGEWFNRRIIRNGKMKKMFSGTLKNPTVSFKTL